MTTSNNFSSLGYHLIMCSRSFCNISAFPNSLRMSSESSSRFRNLIKSFIASKINILAKMYQSNVNNFQEEEDQRQVSFDQSSSSNSIYKHNICYSMKIFKFVNENTKYNVPVTYIYIYYITKYVMSSLFVFFILLYVDLCMPLVDPKLEK